MTRNDSDFYVKFGSNASEWARGLDAQLAPAVKTLSSLQATMNRLDRQGDRLKEKLARDLDARGKSQPGGAVGAGSGKAPLYIQNQLEEAANAATDMLQQVNAVVLQMAKLPDAIKRSMREINGTINQGPGVRPDQSRNAAGGVFTTAGAAGSANARVLDLVKAVERTQRTTGPAPAISGISGVGSQAINEAGFKRIVDSIEAQTKSLTAALGKIKVEGTVNAVAAGDSSYTAPATSKKSKKAATEAKVAQADGSLDDKVARIQSKMERLDQMTAQVMELGKAKLAGLERELGKDSPEYQNLKKQLDKELSGLKADRAKVEREETGKSRGSQRDDRRASAQKEREERPLISNKEIERRLRDQSWLATASNPELPSMVGRGKGPGVFGGADLKEMRRVLGESGFETGIKSKDKLAVQAEKIVKAAERMAATLGGDLPENLRTEGFNKYRETEVGAGTQRMLSMANDSVVQALVKQRQDDLDLLSRSARGGTQTREPSKGTREFGSGTLGVNDRLPNTFSYDRRPVQGPLPQNYSNLYGSGKGSYTPDEVRDAERRLGELAPEMKDLATQLMRTPNFDPYDNVENKIKKGSTPEEVEQANAARLVVTQMRQAATEIDVAGRDFVNAGDKIEQLSVKIADIQARLLRSASTPKGEEGYLGRGQERKLEAEQDRLRQQQENAMRFRSKSRGEYGDLFDDPEYRPGLERREESKKARDAAIEERRQTRTESSYNSLRGSTGYLLQRRVPGLGFNSQDIYAKNQDISGKDQRRLNDALGSFTTRFIQANQNASFIGPQTKSQSDRADKAAQAMENAAVKLLNRIEKAFGSAPAFETLTGRSIQNPENLEGEARRADRRAAAQATIKAPEKTDADRAADAAAKVREREVALSREREKQDEIAAKKRDLDARFEEGVSKLNPEDAAAARGARDQLAELGRQLSALKNIGLLEDPAARGDKLVSNRDTGHIPGEAKRAASQEYIVRASFDEAIDALQHTKNTAGLDDGQKAAVQKRIETLTAERNAIQKVIDQYPDLVEEMERLTNQIQEQRRAGNKAYPDNRSLEEQADAMLGDEKRNDELRRLIDERPERISRIASAREEGDLKENSGYHEARAEHARAESRIQFLTEKGKLKTPVDEHAQLEEEARFAAQRVAALEKEIEDLGTKSQAAAKKVEAARNVEEEKSTVVEKTASADLEAKRAQYAAAQKLGKDYKAANAAAKAANGTEAYAGLREKANAIKADPSYMGLTARRALYREINGDGGGTGGGARTTQPGPGDRGILGRILAAINAVNATLKSGVPVKAGKIQTDTAPNSVSTELAKVTGRSGKPRDAELVAKEDALIAKNVPGGKAALDAIAAERANQQSKDRSTEATKRQVAEEKRATRESDKKAAEARQEVQEQEQLAAAMRLVGREAQDAAADLKRVAATGDQKAISAAQTRLYGAVDEDLLNKRISGTDRANVAKTLINANGPQVTGNELSAIRKTSRLQNPVSMLDRQWADQVPDPDASEFMQKMGNMFGNRGFWGRIVGSTGAFVVRNFAAGAVFGITNSLQQVLDQALLTEMTFVRVQQALEATDKPIGSLRTDLMNISTDYGVALNDVYTSAASLSGLFENTSDLAAATRVSTQLQVISGGALSATEAVGVLAATYTAFQRDAGDPRALEPGAIQAGPEGLQKIADTLTLVQNELGVNVETTAEGISSMAGAADALSINLQESAVYLGQISKLTNQTGAAAGDQFSRILGAAQTGRGRGALREALDGIEVDGRDLGLAMNAALADNDMGEVIRNLMLGWNSLSKSQQSNVAVSIAGQRQMRSFQALMHDTEGTMRLLEDAYNANGDAEDRMQALMATLNKQVDVLMGNFQNLASALVQTGILNFFLVLFKGVNEVLEVLNSLLSTFNQFAEDNPLVGTLRDVTTLAIGAAVAFKLLGVAASGLKGAFAQQQAGAIPAGALRAGGVQAPFSPKLQAAAITREEYRQDPSKANSAAYRASLGRPVARPKFGEFRGATIGRGATFLADRSFRVPAERLGRSIERGGVRWEASNGRLRQAIGAAAQQIGAATSRGAELMSAGLQRSENLGRPTISGQLATNANAYRQLAEMNRELYADRQKYSSYAGPTAGANRSNLQNRWRTAGMSEADVQARSTAPRRSTLALARAQEGAARTSEVLSRSMGKVGSGFAAVASSGLLLDGALALVGLGIASVIADGQRLKALRESFNESKDTFELPKPGDDPGAKDRVVGPAGATANQELKDYRNNGVGFFEGLGASIKTKDFWLGNPFDLENLSMGAGTADKSLRTQQTFIGLDTEKLSDEAYAWMDELQKIDKDLAYTFEDPKSTRKEAIPNSYSASGGPAYREVTDTYGLAGANEVAAFRTKHLAALDRATSAQMGFIPDAINEVNDQVLKDLEAETNRIANSGADEADKNSALAQLEAYRSYMTKQISNARVLAEGIGQTVSLTSDQLNNLRSVMGLASSIQAGGGTIGGIDLSDVLRSEIAGVGAEDGSRLQEIMGKIQNSGISQVKLAMLDLETLQIAVKNARSNYFAAMAVDPAGDDATQAKADLQGAIGALEQTSQQRVQEILGNAETLAAIAEASGNYTKAAAIRAKAILDAENFEDAANAPDPAGGAPADEATPGGMQRPAPTGENQKGQKKRRKKDPAYVAGFEGIVNNAIYLATRDIELQIAQTSDQAVVAGLRLLQAQIVASINTAVSSGTPIAGQLQVDLPGKAPGIIKDIGPGVISSVDAGSKDYGSAAVTEQEVHDSTVGLAEAQTAYSDAAASAGDAAKSSAAEARQNAAALQQARLGVAAAWAEARGDSVAAAKVQVAMAKASMAAARAELGAATTASESAQARIAILNAQAQLIGAQAAVQAAQEDLVQSQYQVSIALAEAAGNTVEAASRSLAAARAALRAALKKSGGKATAEVNQAKAALIAARAAARDAELQDQLDTIDFNLEMGKTTQSAAISALQEILRNKELTKAQRRSLLLQIKGMKDELADSQWNFGDIALPTPYEMRRYIKERRDQFRGELDVAATGGKTRGGKPIPRDMQFELGGGPRKGQEVEYGQPGGGNTTTIYINGADIGKVKKILKEVVGSSNSVNTKTTGARRGGRGA